MQFLCSLENYNPKKLHEKKIKKTFLFFTLLHLTYFAFSQKTDSTKSINYFSGAVAVTNNGISIVPSFSLEKPAIQFNLAMGKNRLTFEPDIRFSLAGKPWSMLFWGRYKIVTGNKFNMNVGAHLGLNFKTSPQLINGDSSTTTIIRHYLATELFPRYSLTKNISVGIYYLYSHGLDAGTIGNTLHYAQHKFFAYQNNRPVFYQVQSSVLLFKIRCTGWLLFYIYTYSCKEKFSALCFINHQQKN